MRKKSLCASESAVRSHEKPTGPPAAKAATQSGESERMSLHQASSVARRQSCFRFT